MATKKTTKRSKYNDWVYKTVSCCNGCANDCIYCFAKGDAINKNRKNISLQNWKNGVIRYDDVYKKKYRLFDDPIMFPGTHDITASNYNECKVVLNKLLGWGNRVLLVSKPSYDVLKNICCDFSSFKNNLLFRFTIGATDNQILSFWEPFAPNFEERKAALKFAFDSGFRTSVSIEPMLDGNNVENLVDELSSFINHSIWIGTMNHTWYFDVDYNDVKSDAGRRRVERNLKFYGETKAQQLKIEKQKVLDGQTPTMLKQIFNKLDNKKIPSNGKRLIYWKWHIKNELGLPQPNASEQWPVDDIQ